MSDDPSNGSDKGVDPKIESGRWMKIVGALFGAIVLLAFLTLGGLASINPTVKFGCDAFRFLAPAFAIGTALSAAFLGGGAAISGNLGEFARQKPLQVSLGGGVAVVIIVFFVFLNLKPENCTIQEDAQIQFQGIPSNLDIYPEKEFWTKVEGSKLSPLENRDLAILVQGQTDESAIALFQGNEEVCRIGVKFIKEFDSWDEERYSYHKILNGGSPFKMRFDVRSSNIVDRALDECFLRGGQIVSGGLVVASGASEKFVRIPKIIPSESPSADEFSYFSVGEVHSDRFASRFSIASPAYAQGSLVEFTVLKKNLIDGTDSQIVEARRYLALNFKAYSQVVIQELFLNENSLDSSLVAAFLSALNEGIRAESPNLTPQAGRKLSESLPFLDQGMIDQIIDLTGHEDESVRKQARRFVQTFPMDYMVPTFDVYLNSALQECGTQELGWIVYASAFFYYNRLIQGGLNSEVDEDDVPFWNGVSEEVSKAMGNCKIDGGIVNIHVIDYGRATVYNWADIAGGSAAVEAARYFLDAVEEGQGQDQYYMQSHIEKMERLLQRH